MSTDWVAALKGIIECMGRVAVEASHLRGELRNLAQALLDATEEAPKADDTQTPPAPAATEAESPAAMPAQDVAMMAAPSVLTTEAKPAEFSAKDNGSPAPESIASISNLVKMPKPPTPPSSYPGVVRPVPPRDLPTAFTRDEPRAPADAPSETGNVANPFPRYVPGKWGAPTDEEFPNLIARCKLKAEATRWFIKRQQLLREGTPMSEIDDQQADIIRRAKELPDCFLWVIHGGALSPTNLAQFGNLAGCYDTLATAMTLAREIAADNSNALIERCLNLVAEAQSGLRTSIDAVGGPTDPDQKSVYDWLRQRASQKQIYIPRYMRGEDRADPARWENVLTRLTGLESDLKQHRKRDLARKKQLQKLRYELKVIGGQPEGADEHWRTVAATVDSLVQDGLPPSHLELRELLLPVYDSVPEMDHLPAGFQRTLAEIERYLANKPEPTEQSAAAREPSAEAREVARLLEGTTVVLIGGQQKPAAREAIVSAFGLKDLLWVEIDEYQSLDTFEPYIARPDVAVVLLAIRWSRHSFGEVLHICDRFDKPLVRLPAGYNPNQVAAQIMGQCSDRLAARRAAATISA